MESSEQRLQEIVARLAVVKTEVKRNRRTSVRHNNVPAGMWGVACAIICLTHPDIDPAVQFLLSQRERLRPHEESLREQLRRVYTELPEATRERMAKEPETEIERRRLRLAQQFLREARLCAWVEAQNVDKGIAPMSSVVLAQKECEGLHQGGSRGSQLQWLRRWRKKWRVTLGHFQWRDSVQVDVAQRKATWRVGR